MRYFITCTCTVCWIPSTQAARDGWAAGEPTMLKRIGRAAPVQAGLGKLLAGYLKLVGRTESLQHGSAGSVRSAGRGQAVHLRVVAWPAFHDPAGQASAGSLSFR
jgi:hypothetical protein